MKSCISSLPALMLLVLLASGCKKDDVEPKDGVVGVWSSSNIVITGCEDEADNGTITCDLSCISLRINENETYVKVDSREEDNVITSEGTATVSGSDLIFCETNANCIRQAFTLDGDNLTITFSDDDGCSTTETYFRS